MREDGEAYLGRHVMGKLVTCDVEVNCDFEVCFGFDSGYVNSMRG
jgi:hypothetical protein